MIVWEGLRGVPMGAILGHPVQELAASQNQYRYAWLILEGLKLKECVGCIDIPVCVAAGQTVGDILMWQLSFQGWLV